MNKLKKILIILMVITLTPILPFMDNHILAAPSYAKYDGPYSEIHRQTRPDLWGATLSGNRWIHSVVNSKRTAWHQWMYDNGYDKQGWELIVDGGLFH